MSRIADALEDDNQCAKAEACVFDSGCPFYAQTCRQYDDETPRPPER